MIETTTAYVSRTSEGGWRIARTRVSLDSVVYLYREGLAPEAIAGEFPTLSLEQIHGALAFYLHNRQDIDQYLLEQEDRWEQLRKESEANHAELLRRLRNTKPGAGNKDGTG